jgi:hypothetical protein
MQFSHLQHGREEGPASTSAPRMAAVRTGEPLQRTRVAPTETAKGSEITMTDQETYDPHKTDTEIRQGNKRKTNLRVLVFSGIMIVAAFAAIYLVGYAIQN